MALSKQGGALYGGFFLFLCLARMSGGDLRHFFVSAECLLATKCIFMLKQNVWRRIFCDLCFARV